MSKLVHVLKLRGYRLSDGVVDTFYYATKPGYRTWPGDTPASQRCEPYVTRPVYTSITLGSPSDTKSASEVVIGKVEFDNSYSREAGGRPLDFLLTDYALAGWPIEEWVVAEDRPFSTAVLAFRGTMEMPDPDRSSIVIPVRDRSLDFDAQLFTQAYGGTGGADGQAQLAGKTKERSIGDVSFMEPTYLGVIGGKHSYGTNGGNPINDVLWFADGAVRLTKVTGVPAATQWSVDVSTGVVTLGGDRPQWATCAVQGNRPTVSGTPTWLTKVGELATWAVTTQSGVLTPSEVDAASVSTLDATPRTVGLFVAAGQGLTVREFLDRILGSIWGGYWIMGAQGTFRVGRVPSTAETAIASYEKGVSCGALKPVKDSRRSLPVKQVNWRYAPAFTGLGTVLPVALEADAVRHKASILDAVTSVDAATAAAYPKSTLEVFDSLLSQRSDAVAEAALALADLKRVRRAFEIHLWDKGLGIDLASVVSFKDDIAGFSGSKKLVIIGRSINDRSGQATLIGRE